MKKWLLGATLLVVALAVAAVLLRGPLTLRLVENRVRANMQSDLLRELPDGLHLALCGAGSPLPDPQRGGPCAAVIAGGRLFIVDSGSGAARTLQQLRLPPGSVEAIFLTHFHSDHIDGLGEMLLQRWVGGAHTTPTPVFGPEGVGDIVDGLNLAYRADHGYRIAHHGEAVVPTTGAGAVAQGFVTPPPGESLTLMGGDGDDDALRVQVFRVEHDPVAPAVGYRFDYRGRALLLSGDTVYSDNLVHFAKGVDLLVHEALAPRLVGVMTQAARATGRSNLAKITTDILDYHASPVDAARVAQRAGAARLLFYHIVPPLPLPTMEALFLEGVANVYEGPVHIGRDGTLVTMPLGAPVKIQQLL